MNCETQDRRQHPRGEGVVTKIEDLTYSVLRNVTSRDNHSGRKGRKSLCFYFHRITSGQ